MLLPFLPFYSNLIGVFSGYLKPDTATRQVAGYCWRPSIDGPKSKGMPDIMVIDLDPLPVSG
jgi:hypothetical protein